MQRKSIIQEFSLTENLRIADKVQQIHSSVMSEKSLETRVLSVLHSLVNMF
jgi:hypothetical protein